MSSNNLELPSVTIVIPVYNVAAYVGRCIDSVIAQTYPNLECIVVDDCGSDNSMDIVRERIANYEGAIDFKILRHEHNRGLSAARNTGTDAASGEYVYFLDSDDLITADCISLLAAPLRAQRVDFVLGNYASGGDKTCFLPVRLPSGLIEENEQIRQSYFRGDWFMMAWNKLVNREYFLRERLYFAEGLLHEDNLWSFQLACTAQSMMVVNQLTHLYLIRGGSITTAKSRKNIDALVRIADEYENFANERNLETLPDVIRYMTSHREALLQNACPYGIKVVWEIYKKYVRRYSFSPATFKLLGPGAKLRYLHHLFPAFFGFMYVWCATKLVTVTLALRRRFAK